MLLFSFQVFSPAGLFHLGGPGDDDVFQRAVIVVLVGSHILDLIYHIHTFQHLAEHGISIVQMRHSTMLDVTLLQLLGWQSVGFRTLSLLLLYIVSICRGEKFLPQVI